MGRARYFKTLFIPGLYGQGHFWKNDYAPLAQKVDEIVHFGNIIGCNDPAKDGKKTGGNLYSLNYVLLWRATFKHWLQIVGPNEIMALNFPDEWTNDESNRLLRKRWFDLDHPGRFNVAGVNKGRLITHAGLTHGQWTEIGKPETAQEAADLLNAKYNSKLFLENCFKLNGKPNFWADPVFADPTLEVYPSWITARERCPFHQMHSGGGLNTVGSRRAMDEMYSLLQFVDKTSYTNFGSMATIKDTNFYSIHYDIKYDRMYKNIPEPWRVYIEKMPVIDTREELFV